MDAVVEAVGSWWPVWAVLVFVLGVGRLARVIVHDQFPPSVWFRQKWANWVVDHKHEGWIDLFFCFWCLSPWIMAVAIGWFALSFSVPFLAWAWWLFWGWLALSYVAAMIVERDQPKDAPEVDDE